ncbi:glycosyltransferase family 2 protein [Flavobacterium sp. 25HG05S-40]|uniref:glycosyltransferase family 2 protein n=1 Tax=Flavobacterium sp. 25HG05S-40 TaxID=3458682 RepID=UPI004044D88E
MKVSIVTITYNRADLIGETIQSVLNQTHQDFEHIIVDDGSTDTTEEVVKSINDTRIKYFKHNHIGNISKLLNIGLQQTTGEIIAILDSDDLWKNNKLQTIVSVFVNNSEVKLITHNISYFEDINTVGNPFYKFEQDFYENAIEKVLKFKILPFSVFVFKKEALLKKEPFNEKVFDSHQEFLFGISAKHKLYFIHEVLAFIRIHKDNTHQNRKVVMGFFFNYYKPVLNLFLKKEISFFLLLQGCFLNTKNLISYLIKRK